MGSRLQQAHPTALALRRGRGADVGRGAASSCLGLALGEAADLAPRPPGLGALAYLMVFGSIVGYTAFAYALRHASATVVGTYAYVNPVVAVLLGWLVLREAITGRTLAAMALILGAVLMDPARLQARDRRRWPGRAQPGAEDRVTATAPMLDRPYAGDDELEELVSGFEDGTLPKPRWTHRAHLAVGWSTATACRRRWHWTLLRERIRRYNVASGGENTSTAGYHETITRFYIYIVRRFIAEDQDGGRPGRSGANRLTSGMETAVCPDAYYSEARLFSEEARARWIDPDLRPLD